MEDMLSAALDAFYEIEETHMVATAPAAEGNDDESTADDDSSVGSHHRSGVGSVAGTRGVVNFHAHVSLSPTTPP